MWATASLTVVLCLACGRSAEEPGRSADALFSGLVSVGEPGVAVLVLKEGRPVFERCYGVADIRTGRAIDARTNFRLASLTKQFTAAGVMLLVRDGKLSYERRLSDVFPEFPEYGRGVTIRHLLQHTSGLPDYEGLLPPADPGLPLEEQQISDQEVLELLARQKSGKFPAGAKWDYSNSGYVLLGLVIERVSGEPFSSFLEERIFGSLGMEDTVVHEPGADDVVRRAFGHTKEGREWRVHDQSPTSATRGDGAVYSSLEDLSRWDRALREGRLLTAAETATAFTPVAVPGQGPVEPDGKPAAYGFGWFLNPWRARARAWHYGETAGFRTAIQRFIDDGLTVIVLCNRDDLGAADLALKTAGLFLK
jgi:CubicO group peptidase (beta-lactamase class C family)